MLVIVRSLISRFLIQSQLCRRDWNIFRPLSQNISRLARLISLLTRRAFSRATGDGPPRPPRFVVRYTLPYGLLLGQLHGGTFVFPSILPIFYKIHPKLLTLCALPISITSCFPSIAITSCSPDCVSFWVLTSSPFFQGKFGFVKKEVSEITSSDLR